MTTSLNTEPSTIDSKSSKFVLIIKQNELSGHFELERKIFEDLLSPNEVQECYIAVVSIAGPFTEEKRFILNYFLQYLTKNYDSNAVDDSKLTSNDHSEETRATGIWVWPKIFTATQSSGKRIGVMLLDTRGVLSEHNMLMRDMTVLSFGTLISSIQIYNLSHDIHENYLKSLLLVTKKTRELSPDQDGIYNQNLLILIRDWKNKGPYGFNGGRLILNKIMKCDSGLTEESRSMRECIMSEYDVIDCYLVSPYIESNEPQSAELEPNFKTQLDVIVHKLLQPDEVVFKQIRKEPIKVNDFVTYINKCFNTPMSQEIDRTKKDLDQILSRVIEQPPIALPKKTYEPKSSEKHFGQSSPTVVSNSTTSINKPSCIKYSGSAVQILKCIQSAEKFELNLQLLEEILSENDIGDCNIAVISIAGAFRKGKSFMLNLFLRYLNAVYENNNEVDWFGDESEDLKGFDWRSGSNRQTTGIWIWSKIFTATRANGERIGVMLMDTQGISSKESTVNEDMIIFSFSTMLSSVQIFNLFNNIQEDDLQKLQLYTEYAKRSMQQISSTQSLQKLLFLIRDWSFPYEASYGFDGGRQILRDKLAIADGQDAELRNVREYLSSSYDDIDCCLMPHIGDSANKSQNFRGQLKDIEAEFKATLKMLVPELLHPNNILINKINDNCVKVNQFYSHIESSWKAFMAGGIKPVQSISSVTGEANNRTAVMSALAFYDQKMGKNTDTDVPFKNHEEMTRMHEILSKQAVEMFDKVALFGDQNQKSTYYNKLTAELNEKFQLYLGQNEGKRVKMLDKERNELLSQLVLQQSIRSKQNETIQSLHSKVKVMNEGSGTMRDPIRGEFTNMSSNSKSRGTEKNVGNSARTMDDIAPLVVKLKPKHSPEKHEVKLYTDPLLTDTWEKISARNAENINSRFQRPTSTNSLEANSVMPQYSSENLQTQHKLEMEAMTLKMNRDAEAEKKLLLAKHEHEMRAINEEKRKQEMQQAKLKYQIQKRVDIEEEQRILKEHRETQRLLYEQQNQAGYAKTKTKTNGLMSTCFGSSSRSSPPNISKDVRISPNECGGGNLATNSVIMYDQTIGMRQEENNRRSLPNSGYEEAPANIYYH